MVLTTTMSWGSPTSTNSFPAVGSASSRSSLWPTPRVTPAAYPSISSYTSRSVTSAFIPLGTWTPPASCQSQAPTLTWDVVRNNQPSILVLNQFYRTTVTENGEPTTSTVGYECFPPGYRWDAEGDFYFTPGVCPIGYYEATSVLTSSYTRAETQGYCCPSSYSAYASGIGCYSNLVSHTAPIVGYKFQTASALINGTTVTFYDALTSVPAFAAATVMAAFPSMTAPPQVIRPAILIRYGGGKDTSSSGFDISTFKVGALQLTTLLYIIAAVIFCLILICLCACCRSRRKRRQVLVLVPDPIPAPRPVVNNNSLFDPPTQTYQSTPQNAYVEAPLGYPAAVTYQSTPQNAYVEAPPGYPRRRSDMSAYVPPPAPPNRGLSNATPLNPFARNSGPAIPRPAPPVPRPPPTPATPAPAYAFGSTGPGYASSGSEADDNDNNAGPDEEEGLARAVMTAIIAEALASTESSNPGGPSRAPPKFAVPALPPSQLPSSPGAPVSRSPPPAPQSSNNAFTNDIPMQHLPSPERFPAPQSDFLNALFFPALFNPATAGPSKAKPTFAVPALSDTQNPAPAVAPAAAVGRRPTRRESLANKLDLEPLTLSSSRNTRDITGAEMREYRELMQRLKNGQSSAKNGVYMAVRRMVTCREVWNAEDWNRVLEVVRRLKVQYGIEVLV